MLWVGPLLVLFDKMPRRRLGPTKAVLVLLLPDGASLGGVVSHASCVKFSRTRLLVYQTSGVRNRPLSEMHGDVQHGQNFVVLLGRRPLNLGAQSVGCGHLS